MYKKQINNEIMLIIIIILKQALIFLSSHLSKYFFSLFLQDFNSLLF